jgi:hypothetical protein
MVMHWLYSDCFLDDCSKDFFMVFSRADIVVEAFVSTDVALLTCEA